MISICDRAYIKKCRRNQCCQVVSCPQPACAPAPCAPAPCGTVIEATPACGCVAAPTPCGCEAQLASCDTCNSCCLSRREQRKARRQGCCIQTCGYQTQACGGCSAPIQDCSACGGQTIQGCSGCGPAGGTIIESSSQPTPAEEAAPEAPESDSTT